MRKSFMPGTGYHAQKASPEFAYEESGFFQFTTPFNVIFILHQARQGSQLDTSFRASQHCIVCLGFDMQAPLCTFI